MSLDLNRVQELYEAAAELPIDQRNDWLRRACGDQPQLMDEVLELLALDTADAAIPEKGLLREAVDNWLDAQIGPYQLKQRLGQGGMGAVYLAERVDGQIEMKVAVKLIQPQFTSPEIQAHFKRERQLLADLRHAHIADLLDAGTTPDGHPYFIMEFIKGHTIDVWYQTARPKLTDLIHLFLRMTEAVGFAHDMGVLHRDIKPGNLMVTHAGEPKLLDFGIAALIDSDKDPFGKHGPMTPQYAAPEQRRGENLTAAVDIYALGLVMLQLLLGRAPRHWEHAPLDMIAQLTPHGHSEKEANPDHPPPAPIPEALAHVLRMTLAEDPQRRYQGAAGLITDLSRVPALLPENETDTRAKPYDVFFWHHPDDRAQIADLAHALTASGRKLWPGHGRWDLEQPKPSFAEAPAVARVCLLCLGPHQRAPWRLPRENHPVFQQSQPRVVPLLLPDADFPLKQSELPGYLRGRAWITFYGGLTQKNLAQMVRVVGGFDLVDGVDTDPSTPEAAGICPYRGLEVFREEDSRFFVGREAVSQRIAAYLRENRFIGVLGPSGSGKSSVVQAGVLPQIRDAGMTPILFKPGVNPLEELAFSLARCFSDDPGDRVGAGFFARLLADESALHYITLEHLDPKTTGLCLVLDQFEEVFTLAEDAYATTQFVTNLCNAVDQTDGPVAVMLTMRSDFLGKCPLYPRLNTLLLDNIIQLEPMPREDLARAVEAPARLAGLSLEAGLLQRILDDVSGATGDLPLLEHALLELYDRRKAGALTLEAYQAVGGIEGALARRAETEYQALEESDRNLLRKMFTLCLITPGEGVEDTRRRATREELAAVAGNAEKADILLNNWINARLLTAWRDQAVGRDHVDVAHEALIRRWPRIAEWMAADRRTARLLGDLRRRAKAWREAEEDDAHLLRGALLFQMRELISGEDVIPDQPAADFLSASLAMEADQERAEAAVKRRLLRRRNQALAAGGFALALAAIAFFMFFRADRAEIAAVAARDRADLQTKETNHSLARMLQKESITQLDENQAAKAWLLTLAALAGDIPPDKQLPGAVGQFADTRLADVESLLWTSPVVTPATTVAFSPDGALFAMAGVDQTIRLIDTRTGLRRGALNGHNDHITALRFKGRDRIYSASRTGVVRLDQLRNGEWGPNPGGGPLFTETQPITDLVPHPNKERLAIALADGRLQIRHALTGDLIHTIHTGFSSLNVLAPGTDGRFLYYGSSRGGLGRLNLQNSRHQTLDPNMPVTALAVSGNNIYTANAQGLLQVRPVTGDTPPTTLERSVGAFISLAVTTRKSHIPTLAALSEDGRLTLRNLANHHLRATLQIQPAGELPGGGLVIHNDEVGLVIANHLPQIRRLSDGALLAEPSGHSDIVWSTAFSPDGSTFASAGPDQTVILWDAKTGRQTARLKGHTGNIPGLHFSPDGANLASASSDRTAVIWDLLTLEPKIILNGHRDGLRQAVYSPDGSWIATSSMDRTVRLWDPRDGSLIHQFTATPSPIRILAFSPDGRYLAGACMDKNAVIWDLQQKDAPLLLQNKHRLVSVAFSPAGDVLALGQYGGDITTWRLDTQNVAGGGKLSAQFLLQYQVAIGNTTSIHFNAAGDQLYSVSGDGSLAVSDVQTGQVQNVVQAHRLDILSASLSPDRRLMITGSYDNTVKMWNMVDIPPRPVLKGHEDNILSLNVSADGRLLASGSNDTTIRIWDMATHQLQRTLTAPRAQFHKVRFTLDHAHLASADRTGAVRWWNLSDGSYKTLYKHENVAYSVDLSKDGRLLASCGDDETVVLWSLEENRRLATFKGHTNMVKDVKFSPDGATLASCSNDKSIRLWDTRTLTLKAELYGHANHVYGMAWSPDGATLASISSDGAVRLWDPFTFTAKGSIKPANPALDDLCFTSDGRRLMVATYKGPIYLYDFPDLTLAARLDNTSVLTNPIAVTPSNNELISITKNKLIHFWNLDEPPLRQNAPTPDYKRLFQRSLHHFGYRLEGATLEIDPNFRMIAKQTGSKRWATRDDRLEQPKPTNVRLIQWLAED